MSVFGDGEQTRAFSYIADVAPIIAESIRVSAAYNQVFNIGADKEYSVNELSAAVMNAIGVNGKLKHLPARNEVLHAFSDHTKVNSVFRNNSSTPLAEGLKKMSDWAKKAGIRKTSRFRDIELTEKLPPVWLED